MSYISDIEYLQNQQLRIASRDSFGRISTRSHVLIELKPPTYQTFSYATISKQLMRISGCILPGFDPVKDRKAECQDDYEIFENHGNLLTVLFDGHGVNGHIVSKFCKDFMGSYFLTNLDKFQKYEKASIEEMVITCDSELKKSNIDTNLSGTTAVVLYINTQGIHVGSVGDSRAVLSTIPKSFADPSMSGPINRNKFARPIIPNRKLLPIALTIDQKPNHSKELIRIQNAGGEVRKIADILGNPVGPYRVWVKNGKTPGLGMSRSIGDKIASSIGVIPTPVINSYKLYGDTDQFIVIASDGIWDVMENIEIINFIEKFRGLCITKDLHPVYPAKCSNSTIARLVCEEARYRWFGILENEDVCVDDISCVIIEVANIEPATNIPANLHEDRHHGPVFTSVTVEGGFNATPNKASRNDPTRGSVADEDTPALAAALD